MTILKLIIKREFIAKVRNKSFIIMTFLSPLLMVGFATFVGFLANIKADQKTIAIHDQSHFFASQFKNNKEYKFIDFSSIPLKTIKDSIMAESYEGLLYIPQVKDPNNLKSGIEYISNDSPSMEFIKDIEDVIAKKITTMNYQNLYIDTLSLKKATATIDIKLKKTSGEATVKGLNGLKIGIGFAFGYLIMMFIIVYGNTVMRSVIEEKTNRIIEIIISSVKPFTLMMGKIIGNALAGLLQFAIWAIIGGSLFLIFSAVLNVPLGASQQAVDFSNATDTELISLLKTYLNEIWKLPKLTILLSFIGYFTGGYFLYSSIYAAIGAAVDSETDSQQFLVPIIMPLMLSVYIGFFSVMNDPHGMVAQVFSYIPFTSPIVMMMRIPFGVAWYEILISLTILFATFRLIVWFAAKIYRIGILMYGKKPTYKELFKWLRYS